MKPLLFLVAGGSASGKTTVVKEILAKAGIDDVLVINHDDYYQDQSHMAMEERKKTNYDHPRSLDNGLLYKHLEALLAGESVDKPCYDFIKNTRSETKERVSAKSIIIVEGILILENDRIRNLADMNIYVELDDDIRFIRRLLRDINDRGRSMDSVIAQYQSTVKPMFQKHIKPTKRYADVIIPNDKKHDVAVDLIVTKIKHFLNEKKSSDR